jgi:hypothetical protein
VAVNLHNLTRSILDFCNVKKLQLLSAVLLFASCSLYAQGIDSIYFHLYTDSLKKGQHNYINIDGKLSNGSWKPLTEKDVILSCASAKFEGNEVYIPEDFSEKKVTIKAVLRSNPAISVERTIWIKQVPDPALPTRDEIMRNTPGRRRGN